MAEKTITENLDLAKDLYSHGSRNYLIKNYTDAADDLSKCTQLYTEIYSPLADELGMPYLLYAKSLIAIATQGENKLLDMPKDDEDDDDDDDDEDDDNNDDGGDEDAKKEGITEKASTNGNTVAAAAKTNGIAHVDNEKPSTSIGETKDPEAGSSKQLTNDEDGIDDNNEDDNASENAENLQIAWEVLEMAVQIFERQGPSGLDNLAESYFELAGISFENSHFESAINDYQRSLDIRAKTTTHDLRVIAEIQYKIGLGHLILNNYDEAIKSLNEAKNALDAEIDYQKEKMVESEQNKDDTAGTIKEIEELKVEIENKIVEIEEEKTQSIDEVKKELSNLFGTNPFGSVEVDGGASSSSVNVCKNNGLDGAGSSSSNSAATDKLKPSDISHLIKRKQTDSGESKKPSDISHLIKRKQPQNDAVESPLSSTSEVNVSKIDEKSSSPSSKVSEKISSLDAKKTVVAEKNSPDNTSSTAESKSNGNAAIETVAVDESSDVIKRKQPDTIDADEGPSAKRPSV